MRLHSTTRAAAGASPRARCAAQMRSKMSGQLARVNRSVGWREDVFGDEQR